MNEPTAGQKRKQWNYIPALPIRTSPLFSQPFNPRAVFKWFFRGWFPLSENLAILLLSGLSWFFFHPALARCQVFQFDWIAQIFIRNLALMFIVAGGLHLYFYVTSTASKTTSVATTRDRWPGATGSLPLTTRFSTTCSGPAPAE
jgi:hypothetical protein